MQSVNYSYKMVELSLVQRQDNMTLVSKENKFKQNLSNCRPFCPLSTVYKIASASIANRLSRKEGNAQESIQLPYTFRPRHQGERRTHLKQRHHNKNTTSRKQKIGPTAIQK